jgi:hypothetical protein
MSVRVVPYEGDRWEVDIRVHLASGKKHREKKVLGVSKTNAKRWGEERERHLLQHGPTAPKKEVPTLKEFESWLRVHLVPLLGGNLHSSVAGYPRCFLDTRELAADGPQAAVESFARAASAAINFTPVTGLSRTHDLAAGLQHSADLGLALRVTRAEFEAGGLAGLIEAFLASHGLSPEAVDLIVDLGAVEEMIVDGVAALTSAFLGDVPLQQLWRTLTLSACSFPVSMGVVDRHSHEFIDRTDWLAWKDHLYPLRYQLARLPSYSDSAIQHPAGVQLQRLSRPQRFDETAGFAVRIWFSVSDRTEYQPAAG